jgi:pyrroline-5-carboxylate reductase
MPNTPAQIGWGATGIAGLSGSDPADIMAAESLLQTVGITVRVNDESLLDAVTALSQVVAQLMSFGRLKP